MTLLEHNRDNSAANPGSDCPRIRARGGPLREHSISRNWQRLKAFRRTECHRSKRSIMWPSGCWMHLGCVSRILWGLATRRGGERLQGGANNSIARPIRTLPHPQCRLSSEPRGHHPAILLSYLTRWSAVLKDTYRAQREASLKNVTSVYSGLVCSLGSSTTCFERSDRYPRITMKLERLTGLVIHR